MGYLLVGSSDRGIVLRSCLSASCSLGGVFGSGSISRVSVCLAELAGLYKVKYKAVKKSSPIDIGRSDCIEITKAYQTDNMKGKVLLFLRSVQLSFRKIFAYLQKGKC